MRSFVLGKLHEVIESRNQFKLLRGCPRVNIKNQYLISFIGI